MFSRSTPTSDEPAGPAVGPIFVAVPTPARLFVPCADEPKPIGTRVRRGESLAINGGRSPAPVAGKIGGVSNEVLVGGGECRTIGLVTEDDSPAPEIPPTTRELVRAGLAAASDGGCELALKRLLSAGIQANRWTSPDLLGQLRAASEKKSVDTIVCGAMDLDPVLPLQQELLGPNALEVAAGTAALARFTGATRAMLGVPEDLPPPMIRTLRIAAEATGVRLLPLPNEYPLGNTSMLLLRALGRRLEPGRLPTDVGAMVLDVPAAMAVARCVLHDEPMTHVPVAVYDRRTERSFWLRAPVGTKVQELLAFLQLSPQGCELLAGHVLREISLTPEAVIAGGELAVLLIEARVATPAAACIRCGWCLEACPVQIDPAGLLEAAQQDDEYLADRCGLKSCIECGICSHVCPSRLPLLHSIRLLRKAL